MFSSDQHAKSFEQWARGYGVITHKPETQDWVRRIIEMLTVGGGHTPEEALALFAAADRIANAGMWLVVHQTYARRARLDGNSLNQDEFKPNPQGHTGGALNMVPGYVGYLLANSLTGHTRSWVMGQGHAVAAIDSINLIMDNMRPEHAERYNFSEQGLARYLNDFYAYKLDERGNQASPLGSHVNVNTAGGLLEGGYLGFADIEYVHMPLLNERLVAFLSDGAFEEQRGADWAPRWWRAEDSGFVTPIMIFNGRRIDQRSMMSQAGLEWFKEHLQLYKFKPFIFDGTDPAAFACMIVEAETILANHYEQAMRRDLRYPAELPYGVAVANKGAGFFGAGTNDAHNLPLGTNPYEDFQAAERFNQSAAKLFVPPSEVAEAKQALRNHSLSHRSLERDHPLANREITPLAAALDYLPTRKPDGRIVQDKDAAGRAQKNLHSPMDGVDNAFLKIVQANPNLRPRVGNPDEIRSNHMGKTLDFLKHRVAQPEPGVAEAVDGKVITALNEEAVIGACLGNKGGLNLCVTYEAFAPKMLGAIRQELIWSDHLFAVKREPGWVSVPLILTSHTYENGKNERSHQDPTMCEALLGEPSDISRVMFPADYNTATASIEECYATHGKIFTLVVPKSEVPVHFDKAQAQQLAKEGGIALPHRELRAMATRLPSVVLTAIGAFQLIEVLRAAQRLNERNIGTNINYLLEPGRFRDPRGSREKAWQASQALREQLFPQSLPYRVFVSHTRPEVMAGVLRPLDTGDRSIFLGYTNHGGTLDTPGMLFVNRLSWAHIVRAAARVLGVDLSELLHVDELDALERRRSPQGILI